MKLGPELIKLLSQLYEPDSIVNMKFKGLDIAFKTDEEGQAILLFLGNMDENGRIKGSRYARTLKKDEESKIVKDHWELKGKAT
ncbi:hypothetical protein GZH53_17175 [Flavihumibacter sp. R14]|nr:hypothetical protein [Flavihumibacter soli]